MSDAKENIDYDELVRELENADTHKAAAYAIQVLRAEIVRLDAEKPRHDAALRTLMNTGYYWNGGAYFHAPQQDGLGA